MSEDPDDFDDREDPEKRPSRKFGKAEDDKPARRKAELPDRFKAIDYGRRLRKGDANHGPLTKALFATCLFPLTGPKPIPQAFASLYKQWRGHLGTLREEGWEPLCDKTKELRGGFTKGTMYWSLMRNCPPFGVHRYVPSMRCNQNKLCPMCYSRRIVTETYKGLEWLMRQVDPANGPVSLIAVTKKVVWQVTAKDTERVMLRQISQKLCNQLKKLQATKISMLGGKALATIDPQTKPGLIHIRFSTIAVVYPAIEPGSLRELLKVKEYHHINDPMPEHLAGVIARCMRFPVGMLRGDTKTVINILRLTAKSRMRLAVSTGMLRQARKQMNRHGRK